MLTVNGMLSATAEAATLPQRMMAAVAPGSLKTNPEPRLLHKWYRPPPTPDHHEEADKEENGRPFDLARDSIHVRAEHDHSQRARLWRARYRTRPVERSRARSPPSPAPAEQQATVGHGRSRVDGRNLTPRLLEGDAGLTPVNKPEDGEHHHDRRPEVCSNPPPRGSHVSVRHRIASGDGRDAGL